MADGARPSPTVGQLVDDAAQRIAASGSDSARLDAELLVASALGLDRVRLRTRANEPVQAEHARAAERLVARRLRSEPVAYILGTQPFRMLTLRVDERVLIPRPETELLVEWALDEIAARAPDAQPLDVVDVGTGSGAIAIAVAHEAPPGWVRLTATDLSEAALALARENAAAAGVEVELVAGSLLEPLAGRRFDMILSNPPYVERSAAGELMPDVVDYEPHIALFSTVGGGDLGTIEALLSQAPQHLRPGGFLALEVGLGQAERVASLMRSHGFASVEARCDLAGIERAVGGRLPG